MPPSTEASGGREYSIQSMISNATVVVNRTWNVAVLKSVAFDVTVFARGYVLNEVVTIGFSNPLAAT